MRAQVTAEARPGTAARGPMTSAQLQLLSIGARAAVGVVLATLVACASMSSSLMADEGSSGGTGQDGGGSNSPNANNPPPSDAGQGAPTGSGVVVVHSAAFPSFRLCFSNHLGLRPQPDSTVMPEANLVGVEVGSAVRINP